MSFELPKPRTETAAKLRESETNAPKPIREVLVQAAQELEAWRNLGDALAAELEEMANVRVSQMASASRVEEIQRQFRSQLIEAARRLKEMP